MFQQGRGGFEILNTLSRLLACPIENARHLLGVLQVKFPGVEVDREQIKPV